MEEERPTICTSLLKLSYGLGHVYNDLCAAMWFSYTLFYFQVVLEIEPTTAGLLVMIGQIVDSLATPLAGCLIDCTGFKKLWHFTGTIAVSIGFTLIFSLRSPNSILLYYSFVIILFQIGWAVVQISHLSLIPEISRNHRYSSDLTTIRYGASVCCNLFLYIITLLILNSNDLTNIGPQDFLKFKEIALIITFIGLLCSIFFYCGLLGASETEYEYIGESEDVNNLISKNREKHFLKSSVIYLVSLLYMASRLFTILNLIYIPLYIKEQSLEDDRTGIRQKIASVPLAAYLASLVSSLVLKFRPQVLGDKVVYLVGSVFGLAACLWISLGVGDTDGELYSVAAFLGISGSSTMVASLCLTANFVKANGYGGGSVYSTVTFTDKLISGIAVLLVQNFQCKERDMCPNYYQHVLSYVCGSVSLLGLLSLLLLEVQLRRNKK